MDPNAIRFLFGVDIIQVWLTLYVGVCCGRTFALYTKYHNSHLFVTYFTVFATPKSSYYYECCIYKYIQVGTYIHVYAMRSRIWTYLLFDCERQQQSYKWLFFSGTVRSFFACFNMFLIRVISCHFMSFFGSFRVIFCVISCHYLHHFTSLLENSYKRV